MQYIIINAYQTVVLKENERALETPVSFFCYRLDILVTGEILLTMVQYFNNN